MGFPCPGLPREARRFATLLLMHSSEDRLVSAIRKVAGVGPGVLVGIGDDAAVVETGLGSGVLTTDVLVEGVHFSLPSILPRDLGYKAIVVNVSDIAAMAASPRYALVSLSMPSGTDESWVVELYGGMRRACDEYALSLVGGDLSRSGELSIAVTVAGEVAPGRAVLRSGARVGDRIVVTGALGASAGGLIVERSGDPSVIASDWGRGLVAAHQRPVARVGEAQTLAAAGASAMMDISDGLALDLSRMCSESGVGARVRISEVPISPWLAQAATPLGVDPLRLALTGGEDYELLATLGASGVEGAAADLRERFGVALTDVGEIVAAPGVTAVAADGTEAPLAPEGWDHFA